MGEMPLKMRNIKLVLTYWVHIQGNISARVFYRNAGNITKPVIIVGG